MIIAIDGPAASGKGTLGKHIAAHYGLAHLDTGKLYRETRWQARNVAERSARVATTWSSEPDGACTMRLMAPDCTVCVQH
jgi:cytidylate kinase